MGYCSKFPSLSVVITVPQIIIGGRRIGGFDDLERLYKDGKLDGILKD